MNWWTMLNTGIGLSWVGAVVVGFVQFWCCYDSSDKNNFIKHFSSSYLSIRRKRKKVTRFVTFLKIILISMNHKSSCLLIGHDSHICDLYSSWLTGHINYSICDILRLQGFKSLIDCCRPCLISMETDF